MHGVKINKRSCKVGLSKIIIKIFADMWHITTSSSSLNRAFTISTRRCNIILWLK